MQLSAGCCKSHLRRQGACCLQHLPVSLSPKQMRSVLRAQARDCRITAHAVDRQGTARRIFDQLACDMQKHWKTQLAAVMLSAALLAGAVLTVCRSSDADQSNTRGRSKRCFFFQISRQFSVITTWTQARRCLPVCRSSYSSRHCVDGRVFASKLQGMSDAVRETA